MLENHHLPEGRNPPPVYTPEELSWLTGIPDPDPEPAEEDPYRLERLDGRLDHIIDRLIALRDAIDTPTEDREPDDHGGGNVEDEGEPEEGDTCGSLEECAGASYVGTDYRCADPMDAEAAS